MRPTRGGFLKAFGIGAVAGALSAAESSVAPVARLLPIARANRRAPPHSYPRLYIF